VNSNYRKKLSGIFPPNMTCFVNEEVAYDKIRANIEKYEQTGIAGYFPLGSNGEFKSLTDEESLKVVEVYQKCKGKDKVLMAGVCRESAHSTIEFTKKVADLGAEFATILPPSYFVNVMTDDVLAKYYTYVADKSPIPIILYNAPKFAQELLLSPALITRVAAHPNIAGMKDTSKEDISIYTKAVPEGADFYIMAGTIEKFFKGLEVGAIGGVLSIANYLPKICCDLHNLYLAGKREEASKLDVYARALSSNAAGKAGVAGVKAAMDELGYFGGDPRLPVPPLGAAQKAELKAVLQKEGLV
jgi:4-hydroxy-2-oxoglutarate aldolase